MESAAEGRVAEPRGKTPRYVLRLYVTGPSSASARAIVNARRLCESHLQGRYELEILNVADHIVRAAKDQVVAAPTLIKLAPPPVRRFIGDMSNSERLMKGLDVYSTHGR